MGGSVVAPFDQLAVVDSCTVALAATDTSFGEIRSAVTVGAGAAVWMATADVSATPQAQVATTMNVPARLPAVYNPEEEMVPPVAEYVTGGNAVLPSDQRADTANCCLPPVES